MSSASSYAPPLDRLLTESRDVYATDGSRLVQELGLARDHVPELLRMLEDATLYASESALQAPLLACLAIGSLRVIEAVPRILGCVDRFNDEYYFWYEVLPAILEPIGPDLLPVLDDWLAGPEVGHSSTLAICEILGRMVGNEPELRDPAVLTLTKCLGRRIAELDEDFQATGIVVSFLLDWHAVESADLIERAYEAGIVDQSICGDIDTMRSELSAGLDVTDKPRNPRSPSIPEPGLPSKRKDPVRLAKKKKRRR
jgi:hypothetical protein